LVVHTPRAMSQVCMLCWKRSVRTRCHGGEDTYRQQKSSGVMVSRVSLLSNRQKLLSLYSNNWTIFNHAYLSSRLSYHVDLLPPILRHMPSTSLFDVAMHHALSVFGTVRFTIASLPPGPYLSFKQKVHHNVFRSKADGLAPNFRRSIQSSCNVCLRSLTVIC
jgi:hypothetical protein